MTKEILAGCLVGLTFTIIIYVYNSKKLYRYQKVILYVSSVFPPAQWVMLIVFLVFNEGLRKNSKEYKEDAETKLKYKNLKDLHDVGILTEEEYKSKTEVLDIDLLDKYTKQTDEYIKLKSLHESGLLTQQEFDKKIQILKDKMFNNNPERQTKYDIKISDALSEGLYLITDDELNYGFADKHKKIVIEPKFEYASSFKEGLAVVRLGGVFGFINKNGNASIPFKYEDAEPFNNGKAKVVYNSKTFYINKNGDKI